MKEELIQQDIFEEVVENGYDEDIETIANWSVWGEPNVTISLYKHESEDSYTDYVYNAAINHFLTDEPIRMITTMTAVWDEEPLTAIRAIAENLVSLYDDIRDHVLVFDAETAEPLEEEYTITEAFDDLEDEVEEEPEVKK